jgi:outer membrane protein OmpA-like peptidoglycan-associated protein
MILLLTALAAAQDGFTPAASMHQSVGGLELLDPGVGAMGSGYMAATLSATELIDGGPRRISASRLSLGHTLAPVLRLDVAVPWLVAVVEEDAVSRPIGDLRVGLTSPLVSGDDGVGVALGAAVSAPTSPLSPGLSADLRLAVGDRLGEGTWRANLGVLTDGGVPAVLLGVGGEQRLTSWAALGAEVWGTGGLSAATAVTHGYLHVGSQQSPLIGTLAGGVGIVGGPLFRVAAGMTWRWGQVGGDLDGDGISDSSDACPAAAEDLDGFADRDGCPDPDDDGDGVADTIDLCPQEPEDPDGHQDADGCPEWDNDLDGTVDAEDDCPDFAGPASTGGCPDTDLDGVTDAEDECPTAWGRPDTQGCPDVDGDRVPDHRDACPHDPGPPNADPLRSDGCPADAFVADGRIEILGVVHFAVDEAVILPQSFPLLLKVAALMGENPDIALIEIAGHTDSTGPADYNRTLSQRRATEVRRFLVDSGHIASDRLVVTGYGEDRPIQPNTTEAGMAANRRVEFVILEDRRPR